METRESPEQKERIRLRTSRRIIINQGIQKLTSQLNRKSTMSSMKKEKNKQLNQQLKREGKKMKHQH